MKRALNGFPMMALIAVILLLSPAVNSPFCVQNAEAQTYAITTCGDCHGNPPLDGARNATTGAVAGSHGKHATTYSMVCTVCHGNNGINLAHRNGNIEMISPLNADSGSYSRGTSFPQSNNPTLGTCSSTYCHSTGTSLTTPYAAPNTVPAWGNALACNDCHGNGIYTADYRKAAPLYTSGSPKQNAHRPHTDARAAAGADATECSDCHNTTTTDNTTIAGTTAHANKAYTVGGGTATYPGGNDVSAPIAVATGYASGSCSNVSCHPTGTTTAANTSTTIPWNETDTANYQCTDCHSINLTGGTTYHHALNTETYTPNPASETDYPTTIPQGNYSTGTNPASRKCLMCHVKHNVFSNRMNTNAALTAPRAMNLRTDIAVTPTASSGYAATDYSATTPFGICLSCHTNALTKDTVRQASETNSTQTPAITQANYNTSAHQYNVATTMKTVGTAAFNANCSKCHNAKNGEGTTTFQNNAASGKAFGTHDSSARRLLAALGGTPGTDYEEGFCYRCHSKTTDAIGGTKKTVDANDWYGAVTAMTAGSTDIYTAMQKGQIGTATSSVLYLRDVNTINAVPPTKPTAYQYTSGTYTTNTFNQRDMAPSSGATTASTNISTGATAVRYDRGLQFVSPQLDQGVTIASGSTFTLTIRTSRATGTSTDYARFTVYKWNGTTATAFNTSAAPNNFAQHTTAIGTTAVNQTWTLTSNQAVTLNPGDSIVCDVEFYHSAGTTALNVTFAYGNYGTDQAALQLPTAYTYVWRTTSGGGRHNVAAYSGLHKPSSTDETRTYLSANKHVECNDCHDPHEAGAGLHTQGTNTISNVLKGVQGVAPTFSTTNWTTPTQPAATTTATKEYEICFKCHSSYNTALTTWNANWTDVGLEFSAANQSYHPVVGALPATDPGANGSSRLAANQLTGGWTPGQTMYCSDCHGNDSASPAAQGPHGSAQAFILKGPNTYWPVNASNALYTLGNNPTNNNHLAGLFCLNCHPVQSATGASFNNAHDNHDGTQVGDVACVRCHILVPHGGKMSRLIGDNNGTMPSRYAYQGNLSNMYLQSFTKNTQNGYQKGNCQSGSSGCTTHNTAATENW